jgi:hypothetical protein
MPEPEEVKPLKEWTLMFYFASDNPLASGIVSQLKAIKDAGFHQQANVVAYFDPQPKNMQSHFFDVNLVDKLRRPDNSQFNFTANDPFVRTLVLDKLWASRDRNTKTKIKKYLESKYEIDYKPPTPPKGLCEEQDPQESLKSFLSFCATKYKARHYMLLILGHGVVVGNDIFLFDENIPDDDDEFTTNDNDNPRPEAITGKKPARHSLTLKNMGKELKSFKEKISKHNGQLELVGLHSCSMSGIEVAYELQDKANYLLASQGPAYVGSWPYKQILLRIFNDLDSAFFKAKDIEFSSLVTKLNQRSNQYLVKFFKCRDILNQAKGSKPLRSALASELNRLVKEPDFHKSEWARRVKKSEKTKNFMTELKELGDENVLETDLLWLNRMLLQDAFRSEITDKPIKESFKPDVKETLIRIFGYCINNSFDFQLAGYSFDMALCDLAKVRDVMTEPLKELISALSDGLNSEKVGALPDRNGIIKKMILLAHWDAQSFWQEQYTDLFDFCFCLFERCKPHVQMNSYLGRISGACKKMMEVMERGSENDNDRLIVRSEFIGPAYQFSHGFSVFFPWSEPIDTLFMKRYKDYTFTQAFLSKPKKKKEKEKEEKEDFSASWLGFLETYFKETKRGTRRDDEDTIAAIMDKPVMDISRDSFNLELLQVLESISDSVFSSADQLGKGGVKEGSRDPAGDECECPSIKNYPGITRRIGKGRQTREENEKGKWINTSITRQIFEL